MQYNHGGRGYYQGPGRQMLPVPIPTPAGPSGVTHPVRPAVQEVAVSDRRFLSRAREPAPRARNGHRSAPAHLFEAYSQRLMTSRQVRQNIISLVGLDGAPVLNQSGEEVGHLVDLVARVHNGDDYPAVTGMVVRVGRRRAFLDASAIDRVERRSVTLRTARLDLREFHRREGEVLLHRDILDHQLVDTDEVQVIRAADLYLAQIGDQVQLVGVDVSLQTLLRRLGPKRFRWHPTPDRVIDWAAIESFGADSPEAPAAMKLREPSSSRGWNPTRRSTPCANCPGPSRHSFWRTCQRPPSGNSPACSATPKMRPRAS